MSMKLKFIGKTHFMEYHGPDADFVDGQTRTVSDSVGQYLLQDFGDFFTLVKDRQVKKAVNRAVK